MRSASPTISIASTTSSACSTASSSRFGSGLYGRRKRASMGRLAGAGRGCMLFRGAGSWRERSGGGTNAGGGCAVTRARRENVLGVAGALEKPPREVGVAVLGRDRHEQLIAEL